MNANKLTKTIIPLLIILLLSSCFDSDDNEDGDGNTDENNSKSQSNIAKVYSAIEGVWVSRCVKFWPYYRKKSYSFGMTAPTYIHKINSFRNSDCTGLRSSDEESGTYKIGDDVLSSSGFKAKEINFTVLKENGSDINRKSYNILNVSSQPSTLFVGKGSSLLSERPADLDFNNVYKKPDKSIVRTVSIRFISLSYDYRITELYVISEDDTLKPINQLPGIVGFRDSFDLTGVACGKNYTLIAKSDYRIFSTNHDLSVTVQEESVYISCGRLFVWEIYQ